MEENLGADEGNQDCLGEYTKLGVPLLSFEGTPQHGAVPFGFPLLPTPKRTPAKSRAE